MSKRTTHSNILFIASSLLAILVILSCILCAVTSAQFNRRFNSLSEFYGVKLNYESESSSINPFAKGKLHYEIPNGKEGFYILDALVFPFGIRGTLTPGDEFSKKSADIYKIEPIHFGGGIFSRTLEIKTKEHQEVRIQDLTQDIIYSDIKFRITDDIDTFSASHIRFNDPDNFVDLRDLDIKGDLKKLNNYSNNLLNLYLDLSVGKIKSKIFPNLDFQKVFLSRQLIADNKEAFKLSFYVYKQGREGRVEINSSGDAINEQYLATLKSNDYLNEQIKISLKGKIFREDPIVQALIKKDYLKIKDTTYVSTIDLKFPNKSSIDKVELLVNDKRIQSYEFLLFLSSIISSR